MLRLIGGENNFMRDVAPLIDDELNVLPYDDPQIQEVLSFDRIYSELFRAAYMRHADWEYPLEKGGELLLPDLQSHRYIAGFELSLWIGGKIGDNEPLVAIEGLRTQLACARHIARTPIIVNQLIGCNIASMSIDKLELLVGIGSTPNLYWALAMLPDSVGDLQAAIQWESNSLQRSLALLDDPMPAIGDPAWDQIVNEFSELMVSNGAFVTTQADAMALKAKLLFQATRQLPESNVYTAEEISKMSHTELVMRWI